MHWWLIIAKRIVIGVWHSPPNVSYIVNVVRWRLLRKKISVMDGSNVPVVTNGIVVNAVTTITAIRSVRLRRKPCNGSIKIQRNVPIVKIGLKKMVDAIIWRAMCLPAGGKWQSLERNIHPLKAILLLSTNKTHSKLRTFAFFHLSFFYHFSFSLFFKSGHQFWWSCLCPYSGHKSGCNRIGERRLW